MPNVRAIEMFSLRNHGPRSFGLRTCALPNSAVSTPALYPCSWAIVSTGVWLNFAGSHQRSTSGLKRVSARRSAPARVVEHREAIVAAEERQTVPGGHRQRVTRGIRVDAGDPPAARDDREHALLEKRLAGTERQLVAVVQLDLVRLVEGRQAHVGVSIEVIHRAAVAGVGAIRSQRLRLREHIGGEEGQARGIPLLSPEDERVIVRSSAAVAAVGAGIDVEVLRDRDAAPAAPTASPGMTRYGYGIPA